MDDRRRVLQPRCQRHGPANDAAAATRLLIIAAMPANCSKITSRPGARPGVAAPTPRWPGGAVRVVPDCDAPRPRSPRALIRRVARPLARRDHPVPGPLGVSGHSSISARSSSTCANLGQQVGHEPRTSIRAWNPRPPRRAGRRAPTPRRRPGSSTSSAVQPAPACELMLDPASTRPAAAPPLRGLGPSARGRVQQAPQQVPVQLMARRQPGALPLAGRGGVVVDDAARGAAAGTRSSSQRRGRCRPVAGSSAVIPGPDAPVVRISSPTSRSGSAASAAATSGCRWAAGQSLPEVARPACSSTATAVAAVPPPRRARGVSDSGGR